MSKFTFVELFAGIGGVSFGFEKAGGKCLMAAEYDPERKGKRQFAQEAYKILHPDTPVVGDVFELKSKDVPDHDVLSFTFPCQSFSVAGKRGGFDDTRGTLYFEAMRIANEKKPKIIFAENVKGLVNHDKGNTLDTIIKIANECGYIVDYEILNSKYFGVPQNRERWFMIGVRKDLIEVESWTNVVGTTIIPKSKKRIGEWAKTFNFDWPEQTEVTTRLRDILETEVDEKYYLDEEKTAKLVAQLESTTGEKLENVISPEIIQQAESGVRLRKERGHREPKIAEQQEPTINVVGNLKPEGSTRHGQRDNVYSDNGLIGALNASDYKQPRPIAQEIRPVLTPDRMEKRQNGRRFKEDGEESFTLTAQDKHGVAIGVKPRYRIRKLTPRECWRLQGFSDESHEAVKAAGISDSQRYKQAGNAVTVNVIEAIGRRLIPLIAPRPHEV